jgi:hypothetical protein
MTLHAPLTALDGSVEVAPDVGRARWTEGRWRVDYYSVMKDFAGPVATIIAALSAVGVTGYFTWRQWRTAKDKLLLDLFDKRFALYEELRAAVIRRGIDQNSVVHFKRAISRAQFLFGPEVQIFLEKTAKDLSRAMAEQIREPSPVAEEQSEAYQADLIALLNRLHNFFNDFDKLIAPYMSHHQRG